MSATTPAELNAIIDAQLAILRQLDDTEPAKAALVELLRGPDATHARELLEGRLRGELLEVQWEIEEVLEATAPKVAAAPAPAPAPEEAPPEEGEAADRPLTSADLVPVYDDPRGLMLHKTKKGDRWFATQFDPRSGQPQTFEISAAEISQLKTQLAGSPYWLLGGGV